MYKISDFINGFMTIGNPTVTYFNGAITQSQLITIFIVLLVCVVLLKIVKKGLKLLVLLGLICFLFFNLTNFSPDKLISTTDILSNPRLIENLETIADNTDNIKIEDNNISIKIKDNWFNLNEINSLVTLEDGSLSLSIGEEDIVIEDEKVVSFLKLCLEKVDNG